MANMYLINPLSWTINFIGEHISHEIIYTVLAIIAIVLIYFTRNVIIKLSRYLHDIYETIVVCIFKNDIEVTLEDKKESDDNIIRIKNDIMRHVEMLKANRNTYVSIQYLLLYPSTVGFEQIYKLALDEKNPNIREKLLCLLCEASKRRNWYDL